jgi:hypothetical protein
MCKKQMDWPHLKNAGWNICEINRLIKYKPRWTHHLSKLWSRNRSRGLLSDEGGGGEEEEEIMIESTGTAVSVRLSVDILSQRMIGSLHKVRIFCVRNLWTDSHEGVHQGCVILLFGGWMIYLQIMYGLVSRNIWKLINNCLPQAS